jgi:DNA repair ATPase RecN
MLQVSRNRSGTTGTSSSSSRSRTLINGVATSLRVVRSVADVLVDVNGQAASQALRDTNQQLLLLDRIAGGSRPSRTETCSDQLPPHVSHE